MGSQRSVRPEIAAVAVVALLAMPSRVFGDPKQDAQPHIARAAELHQAGKYREALAELTAAYKLDADPGLLYAIAQVHVKLDECALAIDFYQKFLDTHPDAKPSAAAREAIDACKTVVDKQAKQPVQPAVEKQPAVVEKQPAIVDKQPPEPAQPAPAPIAAAEPAPIAPAPEQPSQGSAWYADVVGDVLLGGGIVGGAIGLVLYNNARSDLDQADQQTVYQAHKDLVDRAHTARTYALVAGAGGVALVGAGVFRLLTHSRDDRRGVAIVPTAQGGLVTWSGRF